MSSDTKTATPVTEPAKNETPAKPKPAVKPVEGAPERFSPAREANFRTSSDFMFPETSYLAPVGTPFAHLLRPEYWSNLKKLMPGCTIVVLAEDGSYRATLYVDRVGQGYAQVLPLEHHDLTALRAKAVKPESSAEGKKYLIEHAGPATKWRVVRLSDSHVLKQGLDTENDAQAWLRDYTKALAA